MVENYCTFNEVTPTAINEFISKLVVHERDVKRARQTNQHVEVHFNYNGKFENKLTRLAEPTEQELEGIREEIKNAQLEKSRAYHWEYRKKYRDKNLEERREYERTKAREYMANRKL